MAWQKVYVKNKLLLCTCDEYKRQKELDMVKTKAASEAVAYVKAKVASQARAKESGVIEYRIPTCHGRQ